MASYNELNALIDAYINRNGVQAITGQILNGVLKAMVEQLGRGYTIMGAATPTTDPGTPDGPECYFASETGTYTDFDGLQVAPGELALLCYTPSDGWTKATIYEGFREVGATIDGNVGTPSVGVSYADGVLSFDFHNMKGNPGQNGQDGAAAGFGTISADIAGGVGTPAVSVESSGPATAKNLQFHFTNLKGETGVTSVVATVDNTTGTPACTVSLVGQQLTLAFTGLKGAQGDTGSSVDYPFTIVNNLTTDDATQALSAAQGVVLQGELSQLEAKVDDIATGKFYGYHPTVADLPEGDVPGYAYVGTESPYSIYNFDGTTWTDSGATVKRGEGQIIYLEDFPGYASDLSPVAMREFLQSAIDYVAEKRAMLVFPKGETFVVDIPEIDVEIYECEGGDGLQIPSDITIDFNYSTIKADTNHWWCYNVVHILKTSGNVVLMNGIIKGDRDTHIMSNTVSQRTRGNTDEWNYALTVDGPGRVVLKNMTACDVRGDGLVIRGESVLNHTIPVSGANVLAGYGVDANGELVEDSSSFTTALLTISTYFTSEASRAGLKTYLCPRWSLDQRNNNIEHSYYFLISYYDENDVFISQETIMVGDPMNIPADAVKFRLSENVADISNPQTFWITNVLWNEMSYVWQCVVTRCGRNGIYPSICKNLVIDQCTISEIHGTNSQIGIDIEGTSYTQGGITIKDCLIDNRNYGGITIAEGVHINIENCELVGCGIYSGGDDVKISRCVASTIDQHSILSQIFDTDLVYPRNIISGCRAENGIFALYTDVIDCESNGGAGQSSSNNSFATDVRVRSVYRGCTIHGKIKPSSFIYEDCTILYKEVLDTTFTAGELSFIRCRIHCYNLVARDSALVRLSECDITAEAPYAFLFVTDYCVGNKFKANGPTGTTRFSFFATGRVCHFERNHYEGTFWNQGYILTGPSTNRTAAPIIVMDNNTMKNLDNRNTVFVSIGVNFKESKIYFRGNVAELTYNSMTDFAINGSILSTDALKIFTDGNMVIGKTLTELANEHIFRATWTPSVTP